MYFINFLFRTISVVRVILNTIFSKVRDGITYIFRCIKRYIRKTCVILKLRFRLLRQKREANKKYYPTKWASVSDLVQEDISSYLKYEGKDKHNPFELLSIFSEAHKSMKLKLASWSASSTIITVYLMSAVHELGLKVPFWGIELPETPAALAGVLVAYGLINVNYMIIHSNYNIIKSAIKTIIEDKIDPQLMTTFDSAYLSEDDRYRFYSSTSNPDLTLTWFFEKILKITAYLLIIATCLIIAYIVFLFFSSLSILHIKLGWSLLFLATSITSVILMMASFIVFWFSFGRIRCTSSKPLGHLISRSKVYFSSSG